MEKQKVTVGTLFNLNTYHFGSGTKSEWKIKEKKPGQHYKLTRGEDIMVFKTMLDAYLRVIVEVSFNGLIVHHCPIDAYNLEEKHRNFFIGLQEKCFELRANKNVKKKEHFEKVFNIVKI